MPITAELHGFNIDEYKEANDAHDLDDHDVVGRILNGEPHFWAYQPDDDRDYLFARSKCYAVCPMNGEIVEMADLKPYLDDVKDYPHRVEVEGARAPAAVAWAIENAGLGASLQGEDDAAEGSNDPRFDLVEDLSGVDWAVVRWSGFGLALTMPEHQGKVFDAAPEVFFFKDKAMAALFRTFVG